MFNMKDGLAQVFILNTTTNILTRFFQSYWRVAVLRTKVALFSDLPALVTY